MTALAVRRFTGVALRRAQRADVPAIWALENACFDRPAERFKARQIRDLVLNRRAVVSVATLHGQVVGWSAGLLRRHSPGCRSGRLYALAVHPQACGLGLGSRLARRTFRMLRRRRARRIYLQVRAGNDAAIRLYLRLGFVMGRTLPHYYGRECHGLSMHRQYTPAPRRRDP